MWINWNKVPGPSLSLHLGLSVSSWWDWGEKIKDCSFCEKYVGFSVCSRFYSSWVTFTALWIFTFLKKCLPFWFKVLKNYCLHYQHSLMLPIQWPTMEGSVGWDKLKQWIFQNHLWFCLRTFFTLSTNALYNTYF